MLLNDPILIHWIDLDLLTRLGVAAGLGLLLGLDREIRGHAAGMRTHGLICFSAAAMTVSIVSLYFQLEGERMDPLRIFEATGTFIGIIGAGQWPLVAIAATISVVMLTLLRVVERRWFPDEDYTP